MTEEMLKLSKPTWLPAGFGALALAGLALLAPVSADAGQQKVLGAEGARFEARVGTAEEILGAGSGIADENRILVLEITETDGSRRLEVVPGTEGPDHEVSPLLVSEDSSETLFVAWESRFNGIHSILSLRSLTAGVWSERTDVWSNFFSGKASPQLRVTRDTAQLPDGEGGTSEVHRVLLHLVWAEDGGYGWEVLYAPIVIVDGQLNEDIEVLHLWDLFPAGEGSAEVIGSELERLVSLQAGGDDQTLQVGFVDGRDGQVVSSVFRVLPQGLAPLADEARIQIIDIGVKHGLGDLQAIASEARIQIIDIGRHLHPSFVSYAAQQVESLILDSGGVGSFSELESLADTARIQIIDIGASFGGSGLVNLKQMVTLQALELPASGTGSGHLLESHVVAIRPVPALDTEAAIRLFLSVGGSEAILAWQESATEIQYIESQDEAWSEIKTLLLSEDLPAAQAFGLLAERARNAQ